jgi:hypothetical protein
MAAALCNDSQIVTSRDRGEPDCTVGVGHCRHCCIPTVYNPNVTKTALLGPSSTLLVVCTRMSGKVSMRHLCVIGICGMRAGTQRIGESTELALRVFAEKVSQWQSTGAAPTAEVQLYTTASGCRLPSSNRGPISEIVWRYFSWYLSCVWYLCLPAGRAACLPEHPGT